MHVRNSFYQAISAVLRRFDIKKATYKFESIPEIIFLNIGPRKYIKFQLFGIGPSIILRSTYREAKYQSSLA